MRASFALVALCALFAAAAYIPLASAQRATEVARLFLVPNGNLPAGAGLLRSDYSPVGSVVHGGKRGGLDSLSGMAFGRRR